MRVSVLMAACDAECYVAEAIDSVLGQSRPPDEIIVVDDGSRDRTRAIVEGYGSRVTCLSQPNRGQAAALNRAITVAAGDVFGFLDADDLWSANKLECQIAILEADDRVDAVFGLVRQFVSPDVPQNRRASLSPKHEILIGETKICLLIRRVAYERIGPLDETLAATSFIEWLGRAKRQGLNSVTPDEIVALRRLHLANGGRTNATNQNEETLLALKRVIAARRASR